MIYTNLLLYRKKLLKIFKRLEREVIFMRLQEVLNKFTNCDFLITVNGGCSELYFGEYEDEKKREYWKEYKDKKVKSMAILTTNGEPELCIEIEEEKINENNM